MVRGVGVGVLVPRRRRRRLHKESSYPFLKSRFVPPTLPISPKRESVAALLSEGLRSPLARRTFSLTLSTQARLSSLISTFLVLGPDMPSELSSSVQLSRELDRDRVDVPDDGVSADLAVAAAANGVLGFLAAAALSSPTLFLVFRTLSGVMGDESSAEAGRLGGLEPILAEAAAAAAEDDAAAVEMGGRSRTSILLSPPFLDRRPWWMAYSLRYSPRSAQPPPPRTMTRSPFSPTSRMNSLMGASPVDLER